MPPTAPTHRLAYSVGSEPTTTWKPGGVTATNSATCAMSGEVSLMPMMFGCSASRATAGGSRLTPVNGAALYRMTGTGDASATAVKCRMKTSCVSCVLK